MSRIEVCSAIVVCVFMFWFGFIQIVEATELSNVAHVQSGVPQVVGGQEAEPGAYPFMVMLTPEWGGTEALCGGTLIDPEWVLTAAHCVHYEDSIEMVLGRHDRRTFDGLRVSSQAIYIHPGFRVGWNANNDIALIHLEWPVPEYDTVRVAIDDSLNEVGQMTTAIGWGHDSTNEPTDLLQEVDMPIASSADCITFNFSSVKENVLCAGYKVETGIEAGVCFGDSGGPILTKEGDEFVLVGISSFGHENCYTGKHYSGLTRVSEHTAWIQAHLDGNPPHAPLENGVFYRSPDQHEPNNTQMTATALLTEPIGIMLDDDSGDGGWFTFEVGGVLENQEHTLSGGDEDGDWFTFEVTPSATAYLLFQLVSVRESHVVINIYDENMNFYRFGSMYDDFGLFAIDLSVANDDPAGTYFIHVTELQGRSAVYTVSAYMGEIEGMEETAEAYEPNNNTMDATEILVGETQVHAIDYSRDQDWFTMILTETTALNLSVERTSDPTDAVLTLYDASLQSIGEDNQIVNTEDGVYSYILCGEDALPAGVYYAFFRIAGTSNRNEMDYEISLELCIEDAAEPNDSGAEASPIGYGETQTHTLSLGGDQDWLSFTLPTTTSVGIDLANVGGDELIAIALYDADNAFMEAAEGTNIYVGYCDDNALPPGTYKIKVVPRPGEMVRMYTAKVDACAPTAEPNDSVETAVPLMYGQSVSDSFVAEGDEDWFVFTLEEAARPQITIIAEDRQYNGDIIFSLYDENGDLIARDVKSYAFCEEIGMSAGTYTMRVTNAPAPFAAVPTYTADLSKCAPPPDGELFPDQYESDDNYSNATLIEIGERQTHRISEHSDHDWISFTVEAKTDVAITFGGEGDLVATLYQHDSLGVGWPMSYVADSDDDDGQLPYIHVCNRLPNTYYLNIYEYLENDVAEYTVQVDYVPCRSPQDPSVPLSVQTRRVNAKASQMWMIVIVSSVLLGISWRINCCE